MDNFPNAGAGMTADLAQSCTDIAAWLPVAQALIAEPDQDGR